MLQLRYTAHRESDTSTMLQLKYTVHRKSETSTMLQLKYTVHRESEISTMLQLRYTVHRESEISTCMIQLRNTDINAMLKLRISIENRDSDINLQCINLETHAVNSFL